MHSVKASHLTPYWVPISIPCLEMLVLMRSSLSCLFIRVLPPLPPPYADHLPAVFQSAMLQLAATEIEKEAAAKEVEKQNYLAEHCPPLSLPGSMQELQVKTSLTLSLCQSRKDLAPSVSLVNIDWPSHLDSLLTCGCPEAGWIRKRVWVARKLHF